MSCQVMLHADGREVPFEHRLSLCPRGGSVLLVSRDISERRERQRLALSNAVMRSALPAEEELKRQKMRAIALEVIADVVLEVRLHDWTLEAARDCELTDYVNEAPFEKLFGVRIALRTTGVRTAASQAPGFWPSLCADDEQRALLAEARPAAAAAALPLPCYPATCHPRAFRARRPLAAAAHLASPPAPCHTSAALIAAAQFLIACAVLCYAVPRGAPAALVRRARVRQATGPAVPPGPQRAVPQAGAAQAGAPLAAPLAQGAIRYAICYTRSMIYAMLYATLCLLRCTARQRWCSARRWRTSTWSF